MSDPVRDYLNSIGRVALLTPTEEIELGHAVKRMMALLAEKQSDFTPAEKRIIRHGKRAKERMITANLRLVVMVARKYNHFTGSLDLLDLIQEGNIGLHRAVELFDPERGYKFSTYSFWWIRQGIVRATLNNDRLIRLPAAAAEALRKLNNWTPRFIAEHGRPPTLQECADYCKVKVPTIRQYLQHPTECLSLDRKVNKEGEERSALIDMLPDETYQPDAELEMNLEKLDGAMHCLSDQQRQVIERYYGLNGKDEATFQGIAKEINSSRQNVADHQKRALNKLRLHMEGTPGKSKTQRTHSSLNWSSIKAA